MHRNHRDIQGECTEFEITSSKFRRWWIQHSRGTREFSQHPAPHGGAILKERASLLFWKSYLLQIVLPVKKKRSCKLPEQKRRLPQSSSCRLWRRGEQQGQPSSVTREGVTTANATFLMLTVLLKSKQQRFSSWRTGWKSVNSLMAANND